MPRPEDSRDFLRFGQLAELCGTAQDHRNAICIRLGNCATRVRDRKALRCPAPVAADTVPGAMIELLTTAEMAEADRLTIAAGTPASTLMENAGRAVADAVVRAIADGAGRVRRGRAGQQWRRRLRLRALLAERGYPVRLLLVGDRGRLKGDAPRRRGAGGTGEPRPPLARTARASSSMRCSAPGSTGRLKARARDHRSDQCLRRADPCGRSAERHQWHHRRRDGRCGGRQRTVTFFAASRATCCCPAVCIAERRRSPHRHLGAVLDNIQPMTFANTPGLWARRFPVPRVEGHKYLRGHAVVVSGDRPMTGAARLAARGALRAGAGLVTIACPLVRSRSTLRPILRSWCAGRWRRDSQRGSPIRASIRGARSRRRGRGEDARVVLAALAANPPSCSTPMR